MALVEQARKLDHRSASPDASGSALGEIDPIRDRYRLSAVSPRAHYGHLWIHLTPLDKSPRRVAVSREILSSYKSFSAAVCDLLGSPDAITRVRVYVQDVPNEGGAPLQFDLHPTLWPEHIDSCHIVIGALREIKVAFHLLSGDGVDALYFRLGPRAQGIIWDENSEKEVRDHVLRSLQRPLSAERSIENITIDAVIVGCAKLLEYGDVITSGQDVLCYVKVLRN